MQADEVLLALHPLGQLGDRQGRGVRPEQRVGRHHRLGLGEDRLLEGDLLEHRLDDEVAAGQVGILLGGRDPGQHLVAPGLGQLATGDGLVEDLPRVVLSLLGRLERDVLEDDVDAVAGADVGDPRAHHARTEHRDPGGRARRVARRTRAAAVDRAQVEPEGLDHVLRDLATGEVGEVPALDGQGGVEVDAGTLDRRTHDVVRRRHGCALQLLAQVGRQCGQYPGQRGAGRGAAGHPVALRVPGLHRIGVGPQPRPGLLEQLGR